MKREYGLTDEEIEQCADHALDLVLDHWSDLLALALARALRARRHLTGRRGMRSAGSPRFVGCADTSSVADHQGCL